MRSDSEFNEADHLRDEHERFGNSVEGAAAGKALQNAEAERIQTEGKSTGEWGSTNLARAHGSLASTYSGIGHAHAAGDAIEVAAGIMFLTPEGEALLLQRNAGSDFPGTWCFPGGGVEEGEGIEDAAKREAIEEIGFLPDGNRSVWTRRRAFDVDYTVFLQRVPERFEPVLNGEHDGFAWVKVTDFAGQVRADKEFVESDHPRASDGKFGAGSGHAKATKVEGKHAAEGGGALPAHIAALKIPPAWTDVTYATDEGAPLLATGKDSKGRRLAIYSEAFTATQAAAKFERIHELMEKYHYISDQNKEAQKSSNPKTKDSADALDLIMKMGVRPGSETDTGAKVKAYGATTLEGRHVVATENGVSLRFVGKKGVSLDLPVEDKELAAMLRQRAENSGADGKLFPATNDKALLDHTHTLDGGGFKTKDFRTRLATATAYKMVDGLPAPKNEADYKKAVMQVAKTVSAKLGNTPVIALQSYISPTVFAAWRSAI